MSSKKVSILGFGFSGLSSAWAFHRQGYDVEVFEKKDQVGGLLQTSNNEYGLIEGAANAILKSKSVDEMAKDFDFKWAERKKTIKYKWVFTDQPRRWPLSVVQTLKILKPLTGLAFANPKLKPLAYETVSAWGLRVFKTPNLVNQLLGPALQGVYAQGPDCLSASLSLKSLFDKQRIKTEGSFAPKSGMSDFFEFGLKFFETKPNFILHLNSAREPKDLNTDLIIDTRPDFKSVKYLSVTSVTLIFNEHDRPRFQGFGCLFAGEKKNLGVLFNSDIFEGRSKDGLFSETWIVAEDYKDDRVTVDDLLSFRQNAFKVSATPVFYKVRPWPMGIPNYDIAHERFLQNDFKVETSLQDRKLIKIANYTGDIGLNKLLEKSVFISQHWKHL